MMTGKVVLNHATFPTPANSTALNNNSLDLNSGSIQYTPTEVATAVTFMVALMQVYIILWLVEISLGQILHLYIFMKINCVS